MLEQFINFFFNITFYKRTLCKLIYHNHSYYPCYDYNGKFYYYICSICEHKTEEVEDWEAKPSPLVMIATAVIIVGVIGIIIFKLGGTIT